MKDIPIRSVFNKTFRNCESYLWYYNPGLRGAFSVINHIFSVTCPHRTTRPLVRNRIKREEIHHE